MNAELTKIFVMYNRESPLTAYKSNQIPRIGDILYFPHFGSFKVNNVVYHIADDAGLDGNRLMWIEVFVEEYKEDHEK